MDILEAMLMALGTPKEMAVGCIESARYYGMHDPDIDMTIADCIVTWKTYVDSPRGEGIKAAGEFIASRVRRLRWPLDFQRYQWDTYLREVFLLTLQDPAPLLQSLPPQRVVRRSL